MTEALWIIGIWIVSCVGCLVMYKVEEIPHEHLKRCLMFAPLAILGYFIITLVETYRGDPTTVLSVVIKDNIGKAKQLFNTFIQMILFK